MREELDAGRDAQDRQMKRILLTWLSGMGHYAMVLLVDY